MSERNITTIHVTNGQLFGRVCNISHKLPFVPPLFEYAVFLSDFFQHHTVVKGLPAGDCEDPTKTVLNGENRLAAKFIAELDRAGYQPSINVVVSEQVYDFAHKILITFKDGKREADITVEVWENPAHLNRNRVYSGPVSEILDAKTVDL